MVPVNAVNPFSASSIIGCWFFNPSLNSLNFAIASLMALFMSFFAVNLISATLLMTSFSLTFACLTAFIIFFETFFLFYFLYYTFFKKKDNHKRDVFFHSLGITSFFCSFFSYFISCCGFLFGGAYDTTGIAWFLMFLVWFIPFIIIFPAFYKNCLDTYLKEKSNNLSDSESIER